MGVNVPSLDLNNGSKMPQVGFGLWKVPNEQCADIVYNAIKTGYRLFDGACGTLLVIFPYATGRALGFFPHSRYGSSRVWQERDDGH